MTYTKIGPFVDGGAPYLQASTINHFEDGLGAATVFAAPAPSGGDDTAAVQAVITAAQTVNGTVQLQPGTYHGNWATGQSFVQPKIIGAGENYTTLKPFDPSKPILIMQGGSGGVSGGHLADLTFSGPDTGTGVAGLALRDVCAVTWSRIRFGGSLTDGIQFSVTQAAGFCEFNRGEASFDIGTGLALHYMTTKTSETSFHGSGLTDGVINYSGSYAIQVDANCFPYDAPMSVTVFPHTANTQTVRNLNTNREISFFGTFRIEHQAGGYTILGATGTGHGTILYAGEVVALAGPVTLGNLYAVHKLAYLGGNTFKSFAPFTLTATLVNGETDFDLKLGQGDAALVQINILATNFVYQCAAVVWQNPFNSGGNVAKISEGLVNNGTGAGAANLAVQNNRFTITNNYPGYTATVAVIPMGGNINAGGLTQQ